MRKNFTLHLFTLLLSLSISGISAPAQTVRRSPHKRRTVVKGDLHLRSHAVANGSLTKLGGLIFSHSAAVYSDLEGRGYVTMSGPARVQK